MSRIPENYQRLFPQAQPNDIEFYRNAIQNNLRDDEMRRAFKTIKDALDTLDALDDSDNIDIDIDFSNYIVELLARLNLHLDSETSREEKQQNAEQLKLLLNNNVGYIFDRDIMNICLYSLGIAALASIALLAVAGATTFLMVNPVMSFMIVLPVFVLIAMGVMIQDPAYLEYRFEALVGALIFSIQVLSVAPGLFLATAGTYLAAVATLAGVYLGSQHCVNEIAFSANSYSLKSNACTVMNMGMFRNPPEVQDADETSLAHTLEMA